LATSLVDSFQGKVPFSDAHNGVFLASPRRTGKSTFFQIELKPALEKEGVVVVYVDLWADKNIEPGSLIAEAIGQELLRHANVVAKAVKTTGAKEVSIFGIKIDPTKIGQHDGATLTQALKTLIELSKKPVALIVDEAQHSLTTSNGENTMYALKSARDQINTPFKTELMLVMSGSDRDKLLRLVNSNAAPFLGSDVQHMPVLEMEFINHAVKEIEKQRPDLKPIKGEVLWEAFKISGNRPQIFISTLGETLKLENKPYSRFEDLVYAAAIQRRASEETQMKSSYLALKPLEQAIMWRLFEKGSYFHPYDADSLLFYKEKTKNKVSSQQVQNTLDSMRAQNPSLIWKSARGEYALDDIMMIQWYSQRLKDKEWPPQNSDIELQ
jgi:hypothetical protein